MTHTPHQSVALIHQPTASRPPRKSTEEEDDDAKRKSGANIGTVAISRLEFPRFQALIFPCFTVVAAAKDGKSGFSVAKGDFQPDKIQRSAEAAMVLSDVSETVPR